MQCDGVPELPTINEDEIFEGDVTHEELKNEKNRLFIYEIDEEYKIQFDKFDASFYACLFAKLSHPLYTKLWEFLKLCLEGVRQIKKQNKKGLEIAVRIEKHFKS